MWQHQTVQTIIKDLGEIIQDSSNVPAGWRLKAIVNDDNLTYLALNDSTHEAIFVDPMREDWETHRKLVKEHPQYRWICVIDTHTHADHVSNAAQLAEHLRVPLVMHESAPSRRVDLRVSRDTCLNAQGGPIRFVATPGHTQDCMIVIWGPFLFGGDTLMYGDTGRDDLPTGDPVAHFESLQKIKKVATPDLIMLPNHDGKGGRASSWKTQLEVNASLTQNRDDFVREATAYVGPAPKTLKESLFENFK